MLNKISFECDKKIHGNRMVMLNPEVRLLPGVNTLSTEAFLKYEVYKHPSVVVTDEITKLIGLNKTNVIASQVKISDEPINLRQSLAKEDIMPADVYTARVIAVGDIPRSLEKIKKVKDVRVLVDAINLTKKKVIKKAAQARIFELDPTNPFAQKQIENVIEDTEE